MAQMEIGIAKFLKRAGKCTRDDVFVEFESAQVTQAPRPEGRRTVRRDNPVTPPSHWIEPLRE